MKDFKSKGQSGAEDRSAEELAEQAKKILSAVQGGGQEAVLREIVRRAEAGKRAGTLTNAQIDEFYARFASVLTEEQRTRFTAVVEQLKRL